MTRELFFKEKHRASYFIGSCSEKVLGFVAYMKTMENPKVYNVTCIYNANDNDIIDRILDKTRKLEA